MLGTRNIAINNGINFDDCSDIGKDIRRYRNSDFELRISKKIMKFTK